MSYKINAKFVSVVLSGFKKYIATLTVGLVFILQGCGGGGGGGAPAPDIKQPPATPRSVDGGGVKGPLSNAVVTAYAVDTSQAGFKGAVIDTATTNDSAAIEGLELPVPLTPPYILEFTSDAGTTDITTGAAPVISTLRTVVTQAMLDGGIAIYASPQTTMATDIAINNADSDVAPYTGNNDGNATTAEFLAALPTAAAQVMSTLGFGASNKVDIFTTPPLINSDTDTTEEQAAVAEYRTAIEALTAIVHAMGSNGSGTAQTAEDMLTELTADLSDGVIDGNVDGAPSSIIDPADITELTSTDPASLVIPGTTITVGDVESVLVDEKATTGETISTTELEAGGSIDVTPTPAIETPSNDGDTIPDFIDNCPASSNEDQADSNSNGVGDVCDTAPVAVDGDGPYVVDEGASLTGAASVLANDTDTEGDVLSAILVGQATNGSVTLNANGTFDYTHNGSETTADSFTYKANDGTSDSNTVTVNIAITPVNDAPVAVNDDSYIVLEGGTLTGAASVLLNDTDAEDNALTPSVVSTTSNGTLTLNIDGSFDYTHDGSETTTDSFTYKVNDGSDSNIATVTISITPVNDLPVAVDDSGFSVNEGESLTGNVVVNDIDVDLPGDTLTAKLESGPTNSASFVLHPNGTFDYTHNGSETTTDSFTYRVNDGVAVDDSNIATVSISINPVSDAPVAVAGDGPYTVDEGAGLTAAASVLTNDTDTEGDELSAILVSQATNGTVTLSANGTFDYAHNGSETTTDSFTYKANDGTSDSNVVTVNITITPVNDAPVAVNDNIHTVAEGGALTNAATVLGNDTDEEGDTLTASLVSTTSNGVLTLKIDGSFDYTHNGGESSSDSFTYRANDGDIDSNVATVTITITPENDAPVAVADPYSVDEAGTLTTVVATGVLSNDTDIDGDTLTAILVDSPANASSFTLNSDGTFTYTHDGSETTSDSFTYKANDGTVDSNTVTVSITVNPVNDEPAAVDGDGPYSVDEGGTLTGAASVLTNDTDAEADSLTAVLFSSTSNGDLTLNGDGTFNYIHNGGETTSDSFVYRAFDGNNHSNTVVVSITVNPVDDPAVLTGDAASITEDAAPTVSGNVLDNDSDVDSVLNVTNDVALSGTGTYGTFSIDNLGAWMYTLDNANPAVQALNNGDTLTETFTYEANGLSADLVITINGANESGTVDISGIWELTFTHVSETGAGCTGTAPGTENKQLLSFVQSGSTLTAINSGGVAMTGTINEVTGAFTVTGTENVERADLSDVSNLTPVIVNESTISISASSPNSSTMSGTDSVTIVEFPGPDECTKTQSISGHHLYTPTGSENYSGMYTFELLFAGISPGSMSTPEQETFVMEMVVSGTTLSVHFAEYPDETFTISGASFDPATGFYQFSIAGVSKYDYDGNPDTFEGTDVFNNVITGILVGDPAVFKGENGAPLGTLIEKGYEHSFSGDIDLPGAFPTFASNFNSFGYGKMLTTNAFSRTQLIQNGSQQDDVEIKIGLNNPPLRRSSLTSKLYLQVIDETGPTVLCTAPYVFDGVQNGRYVEKFNKPDPDMALIQFRGNNYSRISCNTSDVNGTDRVFDGSTYRVQIIDTGADGVLGGGDDSVAFEAPAYVAKVAGTEGSPDVTRYTETPQLHTISINGATSSQTMGGSVVPLTGYIDPGEPLLVTWPALAGTDTYQLRLEETGNGVTEHRYSTTGTSASIEVSQLNQQFNLRLVAENNISPPTGPTAQSYSRKLNIAYGINGLFNIELGNIPDIRAAAFQVNLGSDNWGIQHCEIMNNPAFTCNAFDSRIYYDTDIVSLSITDNNGSIAAGGASNTFTLELHFKTTGVITSGTAIVSSPDDVAGIQDTPDGTTATASAVNSELYLRSYKYSDGTALTRVVMVNPVEEFVYQKAVVKVNDNSQFVVAGAGTGTASKKVWDDTDGITPNNDFANRYDSFLLYPTDDGQPQSIGRFVSVRSDTALGLGVGLLAADLYKVVLSNPLDPDDKLTFRKQYLALDPSSYNAPTLSNIVVVRPGTTDVSCSAGSFCNDANPVDVTASPNNFGLRWTVPTPPADGRRWQIVMKIPGTDVHIRAGFVTPTAPEGGAEITFVDNGDSTTTYTWHNPGVNLSPGMTMEFQIRVADPNLDVIGASSGVDKVYLTIP
ncbi:MAG: Ig-like domain-containing protein [Gammaproteobacteria bacterium]|nr:Ig-like domain-containing protein [Gammaproteobacteria bacterium]